MISKTKRSRPCIACRAGRLACYDGDSADCCLRCQKRGLSPCVPVVDESSSRDDNEHSEIRSQLSRFEAVLYSINKQALEKQASRGPVASTSRQTPEIPLKRDLVEVQDLVGALTGLCFSADGVSGGPRGKLSHNELVLEAVEMLSKEDVDSLTQLPAGGFSFKPVPPKPTLRDLIEALPPEEEVMWLLESVYAASWTRSLDGLFYPTFPFQVRELLRPGGPPPHPHALAELMGVLAIACSVVQTGRNLEPFPDQRQKWQAQVDRYAELLQRALILGNYVEEPTLQSARALCLLAELHLCCSSSTSRLSRGLAVLPIAFAALNHLGFHAPESDFAGQETPEQQYSRRALVITLLRVDWQLSYAFGRRCITDPRTWPVELPEDPRDEDLPPAARSGPFYRTPVLMQSMRSCFRIIRLQQQMLADVFGRPKGVDYAAVRQYSAKIDALWQEVVLPEWRFYDDPVTGLRMFEADRVKPGKTLSLDERLARSNVLARAHKLKLALHRPFVQPEGAAFDPVVDVAWHREAVHELCSFTVLFADAFDLFGSFCSLKATIFDAVICHCLMIYSNPDLSEVARYRRELCASLHAMVSSPAAPAVVHKLAKMAKFLLAQPKLRHEAATCAGRDAKRVDRKKPRNGQFVNGYDALPPGPPQSEQSELHFNFHFEPKQPASKSPSPVFDPTQVDPDLKRKPVFNAARRASSSTDSSRSSASASRATIATAVRDPVASSHYAAAHGLVSSSSAPAAAPLPSPGFQQFSVGWLQGDYDLMTGGVQRAQMASVHPSYVPAADQPLQHSDALAAQPLFATAPMLYSGVVAPAPEELDDLDQWLLKLPT